MYSNIDLYSTMLNYLRTDAEAADIRGVIYGGADSIYEAGEITPQKLTSLASDRDDAGETDKILCIAVQDAGDEPHPHKDKLLEHVIIRTYDRLRGYRNLRSARLAILDALRNKRAFVFTLGNRRGMLRLSYTGRTGHRLEERYAVDFEVFAFDAIVEFDGG